MKLYDKKGIPVHIGDTVKVLHYIAAVRREKKYMYKFVIGIEVTKSKKQVMKLSHLNEKGEYYYETIDGRTMDNWEIVQGYNGGYFKDRLKGGAK